MAMNLKHSLNMVSPSDNYDHPSEQPLCMLRFWKGLLAVWIGGGIGQSMAFLLARYLIGDLVSAMLRGKSKKWDMVRLRLCTSSLKLDHD